MDSALGNIFLIRKHKTVHSINPLFYFRNSCSVLRTDTMTDIVLPALWEKKEMKTDFGMVTVALRQFSTQETVFSVWAFGAVFPQRPALAAPTRGIFGHERASSKTVWAFPTSTSKFSGILCQDQSLNPFTSLSRASHSLQRKKARALGASAPSNPC